MANIITDIVTRIKTDYIEFRTDWITRWNTRREMKALDSAIKRAKERHERDHKTYYIVVDIRGGVSALTRKEIEIWANAGLFGKKKRLTIFDIYRMSVDIISSNQRIISEYKQAKSMPNEQTSRPKNRRLRVAGAERTRPE